MSELDRLFDDLKQKRDELRLQMHLASKEVQDEWDELEEKLEKFKADADLDETGEGLSKALAQFGNEIKLGYERILKAATKD
jgi:SMC interacting uncharacterized protein involved in chromosome segregation